MSEDYKPSAGAGTHPITPPPKLVQQWSAIIYRQTEDDDQRDLYIATQAARWGADQELEACCEWLEYHYPSVNCGALRAARRPKPPSLKLRIAAAIVKGDKPVALSLLDEALPDD